MKPYEALMYMFLVEIMPNKLLRAYIAEELGFLSFICMHF